MEPSTTERFSIKVYRDSTGRVVAVDSNVAVYVKEQRGFHFAYTPAFKALGYSAESVDKAIEDLDKDCKVFFEVHSREGTLEATLQGFGWVRNESQSRVERQAPPPRPQLRKGFRTPPVRRAPKTNHVRIDAYDCAPTIPFVKPHQVQHRTYDLQRA